MRSRVVWVGVAIVLIAIVVLVLLLGRESAPERVAVAIAPADARVEAPAIATAAPVLVDAAIAGYQPPVARIESESDPEPIGRGKATLTGRVLDEDGHPLPAFAIMISPGEVGPWRIPGRVETTDGRFVVESIKAGTWSVFFAVPNLARKHVTGVTLVDGKTTDLGDVVIDGGLTITGRVVDGASRPVAGAKVSTTSNTGGMTMKITQIGATKVPDESHILRGEQETVSDANGNFVLTGAVPGLAISATHATGSSQSVRLPDDDATITLVIGARGKIIGTVAGERGFVQARMRDGRSSGIDGVEDGRFEIDKLAPGTYDVWISGFRGTVQAPRTVTVGLNATTTVTFDKPTRVVTVDITGCDKGASLGPLNARDGFDRIESTSCRDGDASFPRVEPGRYSLCASFKCIEVVVKDSPADQSFAAPTAP